MSPEKVLAHYGPKRGGVRVMLSEDQESILVRWRQRGARKQRSWPNTPANRTEAREWAKGFAETLVSIRATDKPAVAEPIRMSELWDRYVTARFDRLRPNSKRLYGEHWRYWTAFVGPDFIASNVTLEMMDEFRVHQRTVPKHAVTTVNETIRTVKRVYKWGDGRELLTRNRVSLYEVATSKDERTESPPEYTDAERRKLLAALDPTDGRQWRAYVAVALCSTQGIRSHAALHLQWGDIDARNRSIVWRAAWDKNGIEWTQPLRRLTVTALRHARDMAVRFGIVSPWVIPSVPGRSKRETYSPQSLWAALRSAEKRAGVPRLEGRSAHGFRRLLAGDVNALTGNAVLAMRSIGDRDVRMASRYLKDRDEEQRAAFTTLDRQESE